MKKDRRWFNANKKLILQQIETFVNELKLNCDSYTRLRYLANYYLSPAIDDIKRVINECEGSDEE